MYEEEEIRMTEEEMLATLQLVWDSMGLQIHDKNTCGEMLVLLDEMRFHLRDTLQCPYPVTKFALPQSNSNCPFDF